nr:hypothetical protein [uncultured archaeon]
MRVINKTLTEVMPCDLSMLVSKVKNYPTSQRLANDLVELAVSHLKQNRAYGLFGLTGVKSRLVYSDGGIITHNHDWRSLDDVTSVVAGLKEGVAISREPEDGTYPGWMILANSIPKKVSKLATFEFDYKGEFVNLYTYGGTAQ